VSVAVAGPRKIVVGQPKLSPIGGSLAELPFTWGRSVCLGREQKRTCKARGRFAAIVGRENVVAGTDCGLGGRTHADLAWAKLRTLVEGARLAATSLWA